MAEDDYMGDLSTFVPPLSSNKRSSAKTPTPTPPPSKPKRPKAASWQEQRRLDRERRQREEDQKTQAGLQSSIPSSNLGFKMLRQMGYTPGTGLGKAGAVGLAEPVGIDIRRSRAGIGAVSSLEEAERRERAEEERWRRKEEVRGRQVEELAADFETRKKMQWRSRQVVMYYRKAKAALAQLENEEIVEPVKEEDGEEGKKEEEEKEEVITEEDLHDISVKLRTEHYYCIYCGTNYESADALQINCPGPDEDDH